MKKNSVVLFTVLYGVAVGAYAQTQTAAPGAVRPTPPPAPAAQAAQQPTVMPTKIAVINLGDAMGKTKEGQKASGLLNDKYGPKKAEYDKRNTDIEQLTDKLNKQRATMSEEAQRQLTAEIQAKQTALKRFGEDSQNEMDNDEAKVAQEIQTKMGPIVANYALQNGYAVVLDIGSQQTPVLWYAAATNITDIMIAMYDQQHPVQETAPPAKPAAVPPVKK